MAKWLNGSRVNLLFTIYYLLFTILFLYSYTQVDLGLTLTRVSSWQTIQKSFQYVGYFNRPLSTLIYLVLLFFLFVLYGWLLVLIKKRKVTTRQFWWLTGVMVIVLLFAYNAFSYDLFNYMFDAKMVTFYKVNPYEHKALDFPDDPYLGFMHWTHRIYPYGPTWLTLTIPLSFLGWQKFLPTLFLFKALAVGGFLGTVYFIGKIMERINPPQKLLAMAFFAFNPLVIIESLVSAHNEIVMMALVLGAIYLLLKKRHLWALLLLAFSVGIKFATAFLLPAFFLMALFQIQKKKIPFENFFLFGVILMILPLILVSQRTELQPWYLLLVLPISALLVKNSLIFWPSIIISLTLLLHYVPFLYTGNWDPPIPEIKFWLTTGSIISSLALATLFMIKSKLGVKQQ